jgi:hypothetical protein
MSDGFEQQDWVRTRLAGSVLSALDSGGLEALQAFADFAKKILPARTKLEHKGLFVKTLWRVSVNLGEDQMTLELPPGGSLVASRVHTSRGIALKREAKPLDVWVAELTEAIEAAAAQNEAARAALGAWMGRLP